MTDDPKQTRAVTTEMGGQKSNCDRVQNENSRPLISVNPPARRGHVSVTKIPDPRIPDNI
uniref:Uncharacterized protein n=1 Tax=Arundo donax TaxID=35708 RepID=A0A0A8ZF17_ARUDO